MPKPQPQPTKAELSILQILWKRGRCTVREVHESLRAERSIGYTTVLKLLQIMHEKGLVTRDESSWRHVYEAAQSEDHTKNHLVVDLLDRAFDGSAANLVLQALGARQATTEELAAIRQLLNEMESPDSGPDEQP